MKLSETLNIFKKELKSYYNNFSAYLVIILFLGLWEFLYFRSAFLISEASLRSFFDLLPWLTLILIPAVTMGIFSEERRSGTLELLLTYPITELEVVLAKLLASSFIAFISILLTLPIPLILSKFGNFETGILIGQYVGSFSMILFLTSIGIFISSLFLSQIASLLVTVVTFLLLILAGTEIVTLHLPPILRAIVEKLSIFSHFNSISRGVLDLRDLSYFFGGSLIFTYLTYASFFRQKKVIKNRNYMELLLRAFLIIYITFFVVLIADQIPVRFDLTKNKIYTLSSATKDTLVSLPNVVNVTLYASDNLPSQFQPILRDTKDFLKDYSVSGQGKFKYIVRIPEEGNGVSDEAESLGIQAVQFNTMSKDQFQVQNGYLGLSINYLDSHEIIPFIQKTDNFEYQLTSLINKITKKSKSTVAFLNDYEQASSDLTSFSSELRKQYVVTNFSLKGETEIGPEVKTIIISGPKTLLDPEVLSKLKKFSKNGGSLFVMIDPVIVDQQTAVPSKNEADLSSLVSRFGITLNNNLVYDMRSNETISFGGGQVNYIIPYPLWVRALPKDISSITDSLDNVLLAWPSSLSIDNEKIKDGGLTKLLTTTEFANAQAESFAILPNQQFSLPDSGGAEYLLAAAVSKTDADNLTSRVVVVTDADFASEQFITNSPANINFALNAVDWLTQDSSLSSIRIKSSGTGKLLFESESQKEMAKYGSLVLAIVLPLTYGSFRLIRRRIYSKQKYII